jgi:hydroxyethylthiazole kinase
MRTRHPRVHCLTNAVTMTDVANVLLAAGGSAIMGQHPDEAAEITAVCQATLLNIGTPDETKFAAFAAAGREANRLGHPVVLDPVGVGVSRFRREQTKELLQKISISILRCNPAEAYTLLGFRVPQSGVESGVTVTDEQQRQLAEELAQAYHCAVLLSGKIDTISDGSHTVAFGGGDARIARVTGGGCMLSALCALFSGAGLDSMEAACAASRFWKTSAWRAGADIERCQGGMGQFHLALFDAVDQLRGREEEGWIQYD